MATAHWESSISQLGPQCFSSYFPDSFSVSSDLFSKGRNTQMSTLGFQTFQVISRDVYDIILEDVDKQDGYLGWENL